MGIRCATVGTIVALLICVQALAVPAPERDGFRDLLQQGFQLHQNGEYAKSIPVLRRAWELEPKDYFVNLLLGVDLLRTGKRAEALPFLKEASRQRPDEEFPYAYLGESEAGLAHFAEAAIAYRKAAQLAPQSPEAAMALVDFSLARFSALARQLRSSKAGLATEYRLQALARPLRDASRRELLRKSAELDENAPGIWSELAISDIASGDPSSAAVDIERAKAKNRLDLRAWQAEAMLAAQAGNWTEAVGRLNAIARRSPAALAQAAADWPTGLHPPQRIAASGAAATFFECVGEVSCRADHLRTHLSKAEHSAGRSAEVLFDEQRWEAVAALPTPPGAQKQRWYLRGAALAHTGDCDAAIPALERGLGAPAGSVDGIFLLSWCYARQTGEIERRFEQAGGDASLIHLMRGDVLLRLQGNSEAAITEYRAATTARPHDAAVFERLAEAQLGAGQMDAARESAQAALRIDPRRQSPTRTMAEIAMQERNYQVALPYLRQLAAADPADVTTRVQLGTACAQTGSLDEALRNLAPALDKGYPDPKGSLHYLLGTVLRRLGRTQEAAQAFEAARKMSDEYQRTGHRGQDARH